MGRFLDFEGVDAVLFDCDGVLVDSEPASEWAWRAALGEVGIELGDFSTWVGKTDEAIAIHFGREAGVSPTRLASRAADLLAERLSTHGLEIFPDARIALQEAGQAGLPIAVVSNSDSRRLRSLLEAAGLADRLPVRVSSDDVPRPKPDPGVYLRAARLLGAEPPRCLVVEDTPTGVAAARAAGMRVVAVDRGVFDPDSLTAATRVVASLGERRTAADRRAGG